MTSAERIARARTRLLLDFPWFGALSMRLKIEPADIPTFDVDGTTMRYSPAFADSLSDAELTGVIAHEVMHCALLHPFRRSGRDNETWNKAADYVINAELVDAKITLPKGALLDPQYKGLSADQAYAKLRADERAKQPPPPANQPQPPGKQGKQPQPGGGPPQPGKGGKPQAGTSSGSTTQPPCPTGTVNDAPAPATAQPGTQPDPNAQPGAPSSGPMTETDWKIAAEQASRVANAAGKLPGGADRAVKTARESVADWREILRRFIEQTNPVDYSWSQPNRRYIGAGLYMPGTTKENLGYFVVAIDTSGSVNQGMLDIFGAELTSIMLEARPERLQVVYCDSRVRSSEVFTADDGAIVLHAKGGGGTRFKPVFESINAQCLESEPPKALLYFTDLESADRPDEPAEYPVLWITPQWVTRRAPFGEQVQLTD
jgi:predicted metal-dependent peptidase